MSDAPGLDTIVLFGDQLDPTVGPLAEYEPGGCRVLLIESASKLASKRWHRQRAHLVISGMRHLAGDLEAAGHLVDYRRAPTFAAGLGAHRDRFRPPRTVAMAPMSWSARSMLARLGVEQTPNAQFCCHEDDFVAWLAERGPRPVKQEDFYRFQRTRLGILMDGDRPVGGRWNYDDQNREPPPTDGRSWPNVARFALDDIDRTVIADLPEDCWGAPPDGLWPVTRAQALTRLDEFIATGLAVFGPHEDAMLTAEWKLAHSVLSSSMNVGLLHPREVVAAAESAYHDGRAPLASVEGFIRQVIGWREYVWGVFWAWMPDYARQNALDAGRGVPPAFTGSAPTAMNCVRSTVEHVHANGYAHHIERLMVLGNLALTHGVDPAAMTDWMWASFVDGAEWVMVPNVVGMALYADGGRMATKPYASGGAYLHRMSDACASCSFDPKKRVGPTACPFTTLYWDFLARNAETLAGNPRMARQLGAMRRLGDLDEVRRHAVTIRARLDAGEL